MPFPDLTDTPLDDLLRLDGRIAVVTGGALGIGRAICRRFSEAGATVVLADVNDAAASASAEAIAAETGGRVDATHVDVRDTATVDRLAEHVLSLHGRFDIWVNNAGIFPPTDFLGSGDEDWDRVLEINVRGAYAGSRAAARHMIERGGGGVILNLTSVNSYRAFGPSIPHYTASKHACYGITKALAVELGPHGIRVNYFNADFVDTPLMRKLISERARRRGVTDEAQADDYRRRNALGVGPIPPRAVAEAALFLCSPRAAYTTGGVLTIDGGIKEAMPR